MFPVKTIKQLCLLAVVRWQKLPEQDKPLRQSNHSQNLQSNHKENESSTTVLGLRPQTACAQRLAAMSSCGQDSRVFSATVNEVKEIGVSFDKIAAISHDGCYQPAL